MLAYKAAWRGGEVIKVNPAYTSQRCSCCGHVDAASRNGKNYRCTACGHAADADVNAAKNILAPADQLHKWTLRMRRCQTGL